jgi:hypothetical protein
MTKQKKWFRAVAIIFALLLAYASYDISRRTTFPGSKSQLKERIKKNYLQEDSSATDDTDSLHARMDSLDKTR